MTSVKKRNQRLARVLRVGRAILRQNGLCVVYADVPRELHGIFNARTMRPVQSDPAVVSMICDFPHRWVIYLAAFCQAQDGQRYTKSVEIEPQGQFKSDQLTEVLREQYTALLDTCNQLHLQGGGWIASPIGQSFSESQAARIFEIAGVWRDDVRKAV